MAIIELNRIDPDSLPCSVSRMLAASDPAPNIQQQPQGKVPSPGNWRGVTDGIAAARESIQQGNAQQAERILMELLEFAPVEIKAWKLLAKVQRQLGHIEQGIASATRALQLQNNPLTGEAPASLTLARLLWDQSEYQEARLMLEILIDEQPDCADMLALRQQWNREETQ